MFQYTCLNPISHVGLDLLTDDYKKTDDINAAEAVLVRSASMHEMDLPENLIYEAVLRLPADYRSTVHLFYYEQYSVSEIAEMLELSESAVKTRLYRSRGMLKEALKGEFDCVGRI